MSGERMWGDAEAWVIYNLSPKRALEGASELGLADPDSYAVRGTRYEVLRNIAKHAKPDGRHSYPSIETLAELSHCDEGSVRRATKWLWEWGFIDANWRTGAGVHSTFDVIMSYSEIAARRVERQGIDVQDARVSETAEPGPEHPVSLAVAHGVPDAQGRGSWADASVSNHPEPAQAGSEPLTSTTEKAGQSARLLPGDNPEKRAQAARVFDEKSRAKGARNARETRASGAPYKEEQEPELEQPPTPFTGSPGDNAVDPQPAGPGAGPAEEQQWPGIVIEAARSIAAAELDQHLGRHPGSVTNRDGWIRAKTAEVLDRHGTDLAAVAATNATTIGHDSTLLRHLWAVWRRDADKATAAELGARAAAEGTSDAEFSGWVARRFAGDATLAVIAYDAYERALAPPAAGDPDDPLVARAQQLADRHTHQPTTTEA